MISTKLCDFFGSNFSVDLINRNFTIFSKIYKFFETRGKLNNFEPIGSKTIKNSTKCRGYAKNKFAIKAGLTK
jgi:hypothetical protein